MSSEEPIIRTEIKQEAKVEDQGVEIEQKKESIKYSPSAMFNVLTEKPVCEEISKTGKIVYRLKSDEHPLFHSSMTKVTSNFNYTLRIWIRRISKMEVEGGKVMIGAGFKDIENNWIRVTRRIAHFQFQLDCKEVSHHWKLYEFSMGTSQKVKIVHDAKWMCICVLVNYGGGKAMYHVHGAEIFEH